MCYEENTKNYMFLHISCLEIFSKFQKNYHGCDLEKIHIGMLYIRNDLLDYELHDCLWNKYSYEYFMRLFVNKVFSNYSFLDFFFKKKNPKL